jgi:hypothetical protein
MFVCLLVYSGTSNFSAIWRLSPLPVTGLQIFAYAWHSGPLIREGSLSCHTYYDTGPRFLRSHPKDRHLRPTVGFEPPTQGSSDHCALRSNHNATHVALALMFTGQWLMFLLKKDKVLCAFCVPGRGGGALPISWYTQTYRWNGYLFWPVKCINGMQFSSMCYING